MTEIRDISERLTATGERLIGPRGPISIPTPVFFVSLFLFLSRNLLFILSLSWLFFFFFSIIFQPSLCIVEVRPVHWLWESTKLDIAGQLSLSSPPIPSTFLSRFSAGAFLTTP